MTGASHAEADVEDVPEELRDEGDHEDARRRGNEEPPVLGGAVAVLAVTTADPPDAQHAADSDDEDDEQIHDVEDVTERRHGDAFGGDAQKGSRRRHGGISVIPPADVCALMRLELRVCKHCFEGEHGNAEKTAVTKDMVTCARRIREYKDLIGLDGLYVTMVEEGDTGGAEELPAIVASIENDQITLNDTQLVMEDDDGNMLVYPEPKDVLEVLTRNIDQIAEQTRQDVAVELSHESSKLLS